MEILLRSTAIVVDIVFLTSIYHKKQAIKHYYTLILILSIVCFLIKTNINSMFTSIMITLITSLVFLFFTRNKRSLACFALSMLFMFLVDILTAEALQDDFYFGFGLNQAIKILLISLSAQFSNLKIIGKLETFTIKTLVLVFLFINFLNSFYLIGKGV